MNAYFKNPQNNLFNTVIQPLSIRYDCYSRHFIFYLKNHPEYEAVEALVKENNKGDPYIRAIVTRLDKTQIDHINDFDAAQILISKKRNREVCFSPVQYELSEHKGKIRIFMEFKTFKGEDIAIFFNSISKATAKHSRLIDPLGHSANSSLPVMYPERVSLADSSSKVVIDGKKYKAAIKIRIPFLFNAVNGYYSEQFKIGILRAGIEQAEFVKAPLCLMAGEKWVYKSCGKTMAYTIEEINDGRIYINSNINGNYEKIIAIEENGNLKIEEISFFSKVCENKSSKLIIEFTPAIPVLKPDNGNEENTAGFEISIDRHRALITGKIKYKRIASAIKLLFMPEHPQWARNRQVSIDIDIKGHTYTVETGITVSTPDYFG